MVIEFLIIKVLVIKEKENTLYYFILYCYLDLFIQY